jgi:hypothetical protein
LSVPGAVIGMVVWIFSYNSPTVLPFHAATKSLPANAGPMPPARLGSWQAAH